VVVIYLLFLLEFDGDLVNDSASIQEILTVVLRARHLGQFNVVRAFNNFGYLSVWYIPRKRSVLKFGNTTTIKD
jgi:hypothetical protein